MNRRLSSEEYRDLHEDPQYDNAVADAMVTCAACGKNFIPCEDDVRDDGLWLCPMCADAFKAFNEAIEEACEK